MTSTKGKEASRPGVKGSRFYPEFYPFFYPKKSGNLPLFSDFRDLRDVRIRVLVPQPILAIFPKFNIVAQQAEHGF